MNMPRLMFTLIPAVALTLGACADKEIKEVAPTTEQIQASKQAATKSEMPAQSEKTPERLMVGGLAPTSTTEPDVVSAAQFAAKQFAHDLKNIDSAARQVVAGVNYYLTLTLSDRSSYEVVVYQDLSGSYQLTQVNPVKCSTGKRFSPQKNQCIELEKLGSNDRSQAC